MKEALISLLLSQQNMEVDPPESPKPKPKEPSPRVQVNKMGYRMSN